MGIQTSISRLASSAPHTPALVFMEEGPCLLCPVPTSEPSQTRRALRPQARYLPRPLRPTAHWHSTAEKGTSPYTAPVNSAGSTCGYKSSELDTWGARNGLAAHKGVLVYAKCFFCECIHLLLKRFGEGKAVLLFGFFMRNLSCKIWRIQKA